MLFSPCEFFFLSLSQALGNFRNSLKMQSPCHFLRYCSQSDFYSSRAPMQLTNIQGNDGNPIPLIMAAESSKKKKRLGGCCNVLRKQINPLANHATKQSHYNQFNMEKGHTYLKQPSYQTSEISICNFSTVNKYEKGFCSYHVQNSKNL